MTLTRVVLGVDGGSTSTVCVCMPAISSPDHELPIPPILGRAVSGCSNRNSVGEEAARRALEAAIEGTLENSGITRAAVQAVCLAVSGIDCPNDEKHLHSWLKEMFPELDDLYVYNDAVAALASGTLGQLHGCVLVVGTGTISFGYTGDGHSARSSGYGPLLGDQGSGYAIASKALAAVMRAHDGRGPETILGHAILNHLKLDQLDDLIGWAYADSSWARVAALVPVVKSCAAAGDAVARDVLDDAVRELALNVESLVRKLELAGADGRKAFPLVLVGGVLEADGDFDLCSAIVKHISKLYPAVDAIRPKVEPAVGAALLASKNYINSKKFNSNVHNGDMSPAEALHDL